MPYVLTRFGFNDMMELRARIRGLYATEPQTLAQAAQTAVQFLYEELRDEDGAPACELIRLFKTHRYEDLPPGLQQVVLGAYAAAENTPDLRCLTLLATCGSQPDWNDPALSRGHRAIPLHSEEMVRSAPMISQLLTEMGVPIGAVVQPSRTLLLDHGDTAYRVFHVREAAGSPHIVAQEDFVLRYGIRSVLGFGGLLASGDLFTVIMFARVPVSEETAEQFRVIGLNLKIALLPFARKALFDRR